MIAAGVTGGYGGYGDVIRIALFQIMLARLRAASDVAMRNSAVAIEKDGVVVLEWREGEGVATAK
jgi:hypothetical protein